MGMIRYPTAATDISPGFKMQVFSGREDTLPWLKVEKDYPTLRTTRSIIQKIINITRQ